MAKESFIAWIKLKAATQKARLQGSADLANGWKVRVEKIYNAPRGGPMPAWKWVYFLVEPSGKTWGGYDRLDSFVTWAFEFLEKNK